MSSVKTLKILAVAVITVLIIIFLTILNQPHGYWIPDRQFGKDPDLEPASFNSFKTKGEKNGPQNVQPKDHQEKRKNSKQDQNITYYKVSNKQEAFAEKSAQDANFGQTEPYSQEQKFSQTEIDLQDARSLQVKPSSQSTEIDQAKASSQRRNFVNAENEKIKFLEGNSTSQTSTTGKMNSKTSTARSPVSSDRSTQNINKTIEWKTDLDNLVEMLRNKINSAKVKKVELKPTCVSQDTIANSCDKGKKCLRMQFPEDLKSRVAQLVNPAKLQLTKDINKVLQEMSQKVVGGYDVILLTAASSNHFFESQAMIKNVHENVFPIMKNFTFLFYNLGLSPGERRAMVKYCKCQVLDFPFEKFPEFMRNLVCYSWKPVLIKAHAKQANVLIWADASVRFHGNPNHLKEIIDRTRRRGIQIGGSSNKSPFRTFKNMYHYFGDEPCVYLWMGQAKATVGFYGRDPFVDRAILEPWVACAVHEECMCTKDADMPEPKGCAESKRMTADWEYRNGQISYGLCHRFDQSAISLILHKLYQGYYKWVMVNVLEFVDFRRRHTIVYFPD